MESVELPLDQWRDRFAPIIAQRIAIVEQGVEALAKGSLDAQMRQEVLSAAHKLAGSLGTLGWSTASERARSLEQALDGDRSIVPAAAEQLRVLIREIRREIAIP